MKQLNRFFPVMQWFDPKKPVTGKSLVITKACYSELRKTYKANISELVKLIRNERKVLANAGQIVLWRVRTLADSRYQVLFAIVNPTVKEHLPTGYLQLIPETWLLEQILVPEQLYLVEGTEPYWAWLGKQQLYTTPAKGLMQDKSYFLDAIGVNADISSRSLNLQAHLKTHQLLLKLKDLPGQSVWLAKPRANKKQRYQQLAINCGLIFTCFMIIASGSLMIAENRLKTQVAALQSEATVIFEKQEQLASQQALLVDYQDYFARFPATNQLIATLTNDLNDKAQFTRIQAGGALIQLRGFSTSATEVFALLAGQNHWQEVRFDQNIRRNGGFEEFSISMVFAPIAEVPTNE